ncbi:MAG: sugar phosphate isomerase/epimerase [Ruminococcaceae bacterium]|nr:sugar phosphate isomerase/epimerase [Oscillospiraceae bacterium]
MSDYPFKLGVITDEVSQDIFKAAEFAKKHGLTSLEIRSVNNHSPYEITDEDTAEIKRAASENGLEIAAISSPLFKCDFNDESAREEHIEGFKKCVKIAKELGATMVRGFDFWASGISLDERAKAFAPIAEICENENITCVIEFDPSVHSSTAALAAELIRKINHPHIKALFDPGNLPFADANTPPFPDAYNQLKPNIKHIHIKDTTCIDGKPDCLKIGDGMVDYLGLFKQLAKDGYSGHIMLETHYRKNVELTEEQLKRPGGTAFTDGAYPASEESIVSLKNIINKALEA